jgi:hypothetical protein
MLHPTAHPTTPPKEFDTLAFSFEWAFSLDLAFEEKISHAGLCFFECEREEDEDAALVLGFGCFLIICI